MSSQEMHKKLRAHKIDRTPRAILQRINKLEKEGRITGYTLKAQPKNFEGRVTRLILISFKTTDALSERIAMFTSYLQSAPFAALAARTRGEFDWVNIKIFPDTKIANRESDMFRTMFADIIDKYVAFDLTVAKAPGFIQSTSYSVEDFYKFCQNWTGRIAEITSVDKKLELINF